MADLPFRAISEINRARCERWHPGFPADGWTGADFAADAAETEHDLRARLAEVTLERDEARTVLAAARQAEPGGVAELRPGERKSQPARLHHPQRWPDSARRARQLQQRLSPGGVSGLSFPRRRPARFTNCRMC